MLEWEANPPAPKMDYVHGRLMEFIQCFPLNGGCQENREDPKKCGPTAQWFEPRPAKHLRRPAEWKGPV